MLQQGALLRIQAFRDSDTMSPGKYRVIEKDGRDLKPL